MYLKNDFKHIDLKNIEFFPAYGYIIFFIPYNKNISVLHGHTPTPSFVDNFHASAMDNGSDILCHCYEDDLSMQPFMVANL